ncbi:MAG: hypothetical protein ACOYKA_07400, partial [Legionellaceae bacterium]
MPLNGVATVEYVVTNQTSMTRTLTMVGIKGITPITTGVGVCTNPFTLASKQSCTLKLSIAGDQIPPSIVKGPEVCAIQGRGNNNPSPFLCSQPSQANSLKITRTLVERPLLSVTPTSFIFTAADQTQAFTVTNNSTTVTALAISANFTNTALDGNMTQNSAACASVLPGDSCDLMLTLGSNAVSTTAVPIQGSNTKKRGVRLTAAIPQTALLSVSPDSLILQATNGTPVSQDMVVTNATPNTTASNIRADLIGTALDGKVTASTCAGPIAYNETCTL